MALVLYTGTRLYRNTGLVASISEPVFPLLSIRYSFWYIFSPKYFKMHEIYIFCGEQGRKLERQLLFWTGRFRSFVQARDCHSVREFKRFSLWTTWHSRRHLSNKTVFVVISVLITQTLQCVWNKGIIQVSDWFGIRKCDV